MIPGMEGDEGEPERSERCPPIHRKTRRKEKTGMAWEYEGLFNNRINAIAQYSPLLPPVGVWAVSQSQCGRSPSQVGY